MQASARAHAHGNGSAEFPESNIYMALCFERQTRSFSAIFLGKQLLPRQTYLDLQNAFLLRHRHARGLRLCRRDERRTVRGNQLRGV